MSTKIYNGLILRHSSLEIALRKLSGFRSSCVEQAKIACAKVCAKKISFAADLSYNISLLKPDSQKPLDLPSELGEAKYDVLINGVRNTTWDFTFDLCLIPWRGHVLALFYIENDANYLNTLKEVGFNDFHYQNSTDQPSNISDSDWNERKLAWDEVLPQSSRPIDCGLLYQMVSWFDYEYVPTNRRIVRSNLPTEDVRRKSLAIRLIELELLIENPSATAFEIAEQAMKGFTARMSGINIMPEIDMEL